MTKGVSDSLTLALNELMTNVFDHSHSMRGCYVCAQSYPMKRNLRVCIADFGIGITAALKTSPKYADIDDDYDGIKLAVKEGVTSRTHGFAGLGLSHIQRFVKVNNGKMYILSGKGKVRWNFEEGELSRSVKDQTMNQPFHGTLIELFINIDKEGLYFLESERESIF